jgi:hypothetical protein
VKFNIHTFAQCFDEKELEMMVQSKRKGKGLSPDIAALKESVNIYELLQLSHQVSSKTHVSVWS